MSKKKKKYSVTINRHFLATSSVTIDITALNEDEAEEMALAKAKANEIPYEQYNHEGLVSQGIEIARTNGFDGEPEIADVSDND